MYYGRSRDNVSSDAITSFTMTLLRFKENMVEISENRGTVDSLICLQARDKDTGSNGKVRYEITAGNNENLFGINFNTGALSSLSLDFESSEEHSLTIRASDHGVPPRSSETTVKVIVKDTNDPPRFKANNVTGIATFYFVFNELFNIINKVLHFDFRLTRNIAVFVTI